MMKCVRLLRFWSQIALMVAGTSGVARDLPPPPAPQVLPLKGDFIYSEKDNRLTTNTRDPILTRFLSTSLLDSNEAYVRVGAFQGLYEASDKDKNLIFTRASGFPDTSIPFIFQNSQGDKITAKLLFTGFDFVIIGETLRPFTKRGSLIKPEETSFTGAHSYSASGTRGEYSALKGRIGGQGSHTQDVEGLLDKDSVFTIETRYSKADIAVTYVITLDPGQAFIPGHYSSSLLNLPNLTFISSRRGHSFFGEISLYVEPSISAYSPKPYMNFIFRQGKAESHLNVPVVTNTNIDKLTLVMQCQSGTSYQYKGCEIPNIDSTKPPLRFDAKVDGENIPNRNDLSLPVELLNMRGEKHTNIEARITDLEDTGQPPPSGTYKGQVSFIFEASL
ncbi:MAG: hypothetical protein ACTH4J_18805 [Vibrio toranzoniae]|uniref:hypothetical protein n=1 Tax=Vibrio toranzoniae TaxID=1194427 RepID=UPI003F990413